MITKIPNTQTLNFLGSYSLVGIGKFTLVFLGGNMITSSSWARSKQGWIESHIRLEPSSRVRQLVGPFSNTWRVERLSK